jgi:N-terminal domain of anti-restriction factor ArdC
MSRSTSCGGASRDRTNFYDDITNKIIDELQQGRVPWVQPWGTAATKARFAMPNNASTNRMYSGINVLILWGAVIQHGFSGQSWLTFRQALALGGHVRKGERGTTVVYADRFVPDDARQRAAESGGEARAIPFLKRFTVFNTDQCDGLPEEIATLAPPPPPGTIDPSVEALIKATGIEVRIGGNRAIGPHSTNSATLPATHRGSSVTSLVPSGPANMPSKSWLRRSTPRSAAPPSASCRPCVMPTTSAPGSTCSATTIARSCVPHRSRARLRTICSAFCPSPTIKRRTDGGQHDPLTPELRGRLLASGRLRDVDHVPVVKFFNPGVTARDRAR